MSAPENVADAARPITVNITSQVTDVRVQHVWTDADGGTHGALDLGPSWLVCHAPQQARDIAAAAAQLADAMEAHAATQDGAR